MFWLFGYFLSDRYENKFIWWEILLYMYLVKHFFNKSYQSWNLMQIVGYQWEENLVGVESS
jgi:hypothetical protein